MMRWLQFGMGERRWRHKLGDVTSEYAEQCRRHALAGLRRNGYAEATCQVVTSGGDDQPTLPAMETF